MSCSRVKSRGVTVMVSKGVDDDDTPMWGLENELEMNPCGKHRNCHRDESKTGDALNPVTTQ